MALKNTTISDVIVVEDSPSSSSTFSPKYTSVLGKNRKRKVKRNCEVLQTVELISSDEEAEINRPKPKKKKKLSKLERKLKNELFREIINLVDSPIVQSDERVNPMPLTPEMISRKETRKEKSRREIGDVTTPRNNLNNDAVSNSGRKRKRDRFNKFHGSLIVNGKQIEWQPNIGDKTEKPLESTLSPNDACNIEVTEHFSNIPNGIKKKKWKNKGHSKSLINCLQSEKIILNSSTETEIEVNVTTVDGKRKDSNNRPSSKEPDTRGEIQTTENCDQAINKITSCSSDAGPSTENENKQQNQVTILSETILLSDEEDDLKVVEARVSKSSDIIVLGSPVVPTITNYKDVSKKKSPGGKVKSPLLHNSVAVPSVQQSSPSSGVLPSSIANAIIELSKLPNWMEMIAVQTALQLKKSNRDSPQPSTSGAAMSPTQALQEESRPQVFTSPDNRYGSNIYNPCHKNEKQKGLRPIVIDGSNVAMGHGLGKFFSAKGLEICVNYFVKRRHKVYAFLPHFRKQSYYTRDSHILHRLEKDRHLIFTPSRTVDGRKDVPYDDRYIVQTAAEKGGVIVSTDNYRDLLAENQAWHDTIKNRLLMFTWVDDILMFPQDPLGKRGPKLEAFLRF